MVESILPLLNLYILKFLVDSVSNNTIPVLFGIELSSYMLLGIFCLIFLINRMVNVLDSVNSDIMYQRLIDYISDKIQNQSARLDMSYFDNPEYHDTYHRAQTEANYRPMRILDGFMGLIGSTITISGIVVMLWAASKWIIVVMIVAVLPSFVVRIIKARKLYTFRRENTLLGRVRRQNRHRLLCNVCREKR